MTLPRSWRKSSRSGTQTACIEVGNTLDVVRDSKNPGLVLPVNVRTLLAAVKRGQIG
jgi:Domain of unknown function (DUF397)